MAFNITGNLVPIIRKEQFEEEATYFLKKYCPEALQTPMAIPIVQVAQERMELSILNHHLTEDFSVFGQMCFTGGLAEIYDKDEEEYREIMVDRGTMIVDPDTFFQRNLGCVNNTIAHECFHWYRHRNYHFMQSILDEKRSIACLCQVESKNENFTTKWTDEDWMEWQANGIAPRILLPQDTFREMADQFLKESENNPLIITLQISSTEWIINQLANFYRVSKISVKIRLNELGILLVH